MSLNRACLSGVEKQGRETGLNADLSWSADVLVFLGILHSRTATGDFHTVDGNFFLRELGGIYENLSAMYWVVKYSKVSKSF